MDENFYTQIIKELHLKSKIVKVPKFVQLRDIKTKDNFLIALAVLYSEKSNRIINHIRKKYRIKIANRELNKRHLLYSRELFYYPIKSQNHLSSHDYELYENDISTLTNQLNLSDVWLNILIYYLKFNRIIIPDPEVNIRVVNSVPWKHDYLIPIKYINDDIDNIRSFISAYPELFDIMDSEITTELIHQIIYNSSYQYNKNDIGIFLSAQVSKNEFKKWIDDNWEKNISYNIRIFKNNRIRKIDIEKLLKGLYYLELKGKFKNWTSVESYLKRFPQTEFQVDDPIAMSKIASETKSNLRLLL